MSQGDGITAVVVAAAAATLVMPAAFTYRGLQREREREREGGTGGGSFLEDVGGKKARSAVGDTERKWLETASIHSVFI